MGIERFEDLKSWQEARILEQAVYRFLDISLGSCREVQSHLYVALDQTYINQNEFDEAYNQAELVAQLVAGAIKNLDEQISRRSSTEPGSTRRERRA